MNGWLTMGIWLLLTTYFVIELLAYRAFVLRGDDFFLDHSVYVAFAVVDGGAALSFLVLSIESQPSIFTQWSHVAIDLSLSPEFWLITLMACSIIGFVLIALGVNDHHHVMLTSLFTFFYLFFSIGGVLSPVSSVVSNYTGWVNCFVMVSVAVYFFASATPYAHRQYEERWKKILNLLD